MARCTRRGCGKEFTENNPESCIHHVGDPVFHEGLKSWSCCVDVNKPVLEFDEFMRIPGCTESECHTEIAQKIDPPKSSPTVGLTVSGSASGKEIFTSPADHTTISIPPPAPAVIIEEDDTSVAVKPGTPCRRNGCKVLFVSDEVNRQGDGQDAVCTYHPALPIFHEGSKGYLCCKRRVLEFDEFLKIPGCKSGRHVFSALTKKPDTEEIVNCRVDHYQTLDKVHVSIFAKQVDKERSVIKFDDFQIHVDLYLPGSKRFYRALDLFGPINPAESTSQFYATKVELHLQKRDTRSWTVLEKTSQNFGNINLTFGVGGRTGTVGAKDVVLDETNKSRA